eukprot:m.190147 g.190147  ORF g.190147 m.190147 type:complete len:259 (-) comp17967_c0_seq1:109-885(-)
MDVDWLLVVGVLVAIVAVLVTIFFLRRATGGAAVARDAVLLIGPTDSGKTTLLSLLCAGTAPPRGTVTSMAPHRAECILKHDATAGGEPQSLPMVDIPGHPRLRRQLILSHAPACRVVLFVVDSVAFAEELSDVAELLYDAIVALPDRPFLIVCNKQDLFFRASKPDVVLTKLESEFNVIRKTRAGTLESTDDDGDEATSLASVQLGEEGTPFKFDHLDQPVDFIPFIAVDSQAKGDDSGGVQSDDPKPIFDWLAGHV